MLTADSCDDCSSPLLPPGAWFLTTDWTSALRSVRSAGQSPPAFTRAQSCQQLQTAA